MNRDDLQRICDLVRNRFMSAPSLALSKLEVDALIGDQHSEYYVRVGARAIGSECGASMTRPLRDYLGADDAVSRQVWDVIQVAFGKPTMGKFDDGIARRRLRPDGTWVDASRGSESEQWDQLALAGRRID